MKLNKILEKFEEFCNPRKNNTMLRHKFFTYRQSEGHKFSHFVTELRKLSDECESDALKDSLIRDLIICGVKDTQLRERMLREPELDSAKAIKLGQVAEDTKQHVKELWHEASSSSSVDLVIKHQKSKKQQRSKVSADSGKTVIISKCKFCGKSHKRGDCPAYGRKCHRCQKQNHFAKFCPNRTTINKIDSETDNQSDKGDSDDSVFLLVL